MVSEINVEWDVEFWAGRYSAPDLAIYNREMEKEPFERLSGLWQWKSLNRTSYTPGDLRPFIAKARKICFDLTEPLPDEPGEVVDAFEAMQEILRDQGPLNQNSTAVVTPQFLLHIADSDFGYSVRFPVLDRMVAVAHQTHTSTSQNETLTDYLSYSRSRYRALVSYFFNRCSTSRQVAMLERALFVQGQAISRYQSIDDEYEKVGNVPIRVAREYVSEVEQYAGEQ